MDMSIVKCFTFWEGWYDFISELETDEEKLAAYDTICKMAFLGEERYNIFQRKDIANKQDKVSKIRRLIYNMLHGVIWKDMNSSDESDSDEPPPQTAFREKKMTRSKDAARSKEALDSFIEEMEADNEPKVSTYQGEELPRQVRGYPLNTTSPLLSEEEIKARNKSCWEDKIKTWQDLQHVIKECYFGSDTMVAYSENFCRFAYYQLAKIQCWRNSITNKPINNNLMNVISAMVRNWCYERERNKGFEKRRGILRKTEDERVRQMEVEESDRDTVENMKRERQMAAERKAKEMGLV